ncbi:MAG: hypothetical protein JJU11_04550 [Candidatus Sumerlaeia bacterium]|nr:hypothetical protein [Candidatus Sumerlaeia bacterium]
MRKIQQPTLALLTAGLLLAGGNALAQSTWYVDNDPGITTRDGQSAATAFETLAAALAAADNDDTIIVDGTTGTAYEENTLVNKSVTIQGANDPIIRTATSGVTAFPTAPPRANNTAVFRIAAQDVTLSDLVIEVVYAPDDGYVGRTAITNYDPAEISDNSNFFNPNNSHGVANFNGLTVTNNTIRRVAETAGRSSTAGYAWRSIAIGLSGNGAGDNSDATISGNTIETAAAYNDPAELSLFTHGFFIPRNAGEIVIGGPDPADGNTVTCGYVDSWMNAVKSGTTLSFQNNTFTGLMGFDVSSGNNGTYEFLNNTFAPDPITDLFRAPDTASNAHLQNGYINGSSATVVFDGNSFVVPPRRTAGGSGGYVRPMTGIWAGSGATTVLSNNTFNSRGTGFTAPGYTYTEEFSYIYVDGISSSPGVSITNKAITIEGNTFESPNTPGVNQTAIELYRTQGTNVVEPTYLDGGVIIGDGNVFNSGLEYYIRLDDGSGTMPSLAKTQHGPGFPFNVNVDGAYENLYSVDGGAPKLVSEMTDAERLELGDYLYHAPNNAALGYIYLDGTGILNVDSNLSINNAIAAARDGDTVSLPSNAAINAFNISVGKNISIVGDNSGIIGNGASAGIVAPNGGESFTISGVAFLNHSAAINAQSTGTPRTIDITNCLFDDVAAAVTVGSGNTINATHNAFLDASQAYFTPVSQFAGLNVNYNTFNNSNLYFVNSGNFNSPEPNFDNNWFADEFDHDADQTGYITGLVKTVSTAASNQVVTATNVVAQFDRDADGIPDVFELAPGSTTAYNQLATDPGTGLPDGVATGTDPNEDSNGSGYADWYEANLVWFVPELGDVTNTGGVSLADAVRALQLVNGANVPGDLNNLNVTGNTTNVFSIANPLQILRYQAGVRTLLPAVPGVD